jgi:mono/diheme cytochrome c family protein
MLRHSVLFSALLLFAISSPAQQAQTSEEKTPAATATAPSGKIPPEALKVANPVKPTPASIAIGKKKYGYDCAMCHGADGDGKGDLAIDMKLTMKDYRDPASLKSVTDGEMFYVTKNGNKDMPSEADRLKDDDIWNLVNYIRTLSKNSAAATKAKSDQP